ncbi:MAG: ATP-binding protein [Sulfitobacter sp.]|nr:ATP-binding protein [Sulfitobacter sp.]
MTLLSRLSASASTEAESTRNMPSSELTDSEVMAQRVYAVSRLTPTIMIANIINAFSVLLVLHMEDQQRTDAYIWAGVVLCSAAYFLFLTYQRRDKPYRRSIWQAAILGALWTYPSIAMLPDLEGIAQSFLVAMVAGMVAGGAITLYPLPLAAYAFCSIILVGSMGSFAATGISTFWGFALVTAAFAFIIYRSIARHEQIFVSEFVLRRSLDRQRARMGEMLTEAREEVTTERKLAEDRLLQTQKMEAIGQLTAGIAHDFNNLLTAVRGHAELLRLKPDAETDLIDPIIQSADGGAALVRQLLAFARKQTLAPVPICPRTAIEQTIHLMRGTLREDIAIKLKIEGSHWAIKIDPNLFNNALLNLGTNARDAMPQGGTILISVKNRLITEEDGSDAEYVRISVCDTGEGMPLAVREKAVEPFFTTKEFGGGSGLGLSMVYGFVKQSGGDMKIDSTPGLGTCVHIDLPRSLEEPGTALKEASGPAAETGGNRHVLLIEDDPSVRKTLKAMLLSLDYRVDAAESVEQARLAMEMLPERPDILVTDVVLPGGQWGTEFAREVAAQHPDMGILLISGFHADLASFGLEGGQNALLPKPFSRDDLAGALGSFVQ